MSTREQNPSSQIDALNNASCIRIFTDKIARKEFKSEGQTACLDYLRADDILVIYRLDRLGRSVKEMLDFCAKLEMRRIKLVSLHANLDTSTAVGRFTMQIILTRSDEELSTALYRLDYEYFSSMKKWAECHDRLDSSLHLAEQLNITYKDFIIKGKSNNLSVSYMASELRNLDGNISELADLYYEYRILSQTEYYSHKGAKFSYIQKYDAKFINTIYTYY